MIRKFKKSDIDDVVNIWLQASINAHDFVDPKFWESKVDDMRQIYIPNSDTYVFCDQNEIIRGFFSLAGEMLAAIFVSPKFQGKGIGKQLIDKAKSLQANLNLTVYKENSKSVQFYKNCGFRIIEEKIDDHTGHVEIVMKFES